MISETSAGQESAGDRLAALVAELRACRVCIEAPAGAPLPHEPRPVIRGFASARILVAGQAPGTRVHASGVPFDDRSGERLRGWMGVDAATFYDERMIAILPMGFCFPGLDTKGGDRPPRRECAPLWRRRLIDALPRIDLVLAIGGPAQRWHLGMEAAGGVDATVSRWRTLMARAVHPVVVPLPHPSWRNSGWLLRNPWFEDQLLPELRAMIVDRIGRLDSSSG